MMELQWDENSDDLSIKCSSIVMHATRKLFTQVVHTCMHLIAMRQNSFSLNDTKWCHDAIKSARAAPYSWSQSWLWLHRAHHNPCRESSVSFFIFSLEKTHAVVMVSLLIHRVSSQRRLRPNHVFSFWVCEIHWGMMTKSPELCSM